MQDSRRRSSAGNAADRRESFGKSGRRRERRRHSVDERQRSVVRARASRQHWASRFEPGHHSPTLRAVRHTPGPGWCLSFVRWAAERPAALQPEVRENAVVHHAPERLERARSFARETELRHHSGWTALRAHATQLASNARKAVGSAPRVGIVLLCQASSNPCSAMKSWSRRASARSFVSTAHFISS